MSVNTKLMMTFYLPIELMDKEDKPLMEMLLKDASASGMPVISFFSPFQSLHYFCFP